MKGELIQAIESAPFSALQACRLLGLNPDRFYQWRARESLVDDPPIAKTIPHRLLEEEQAEIIRYALEHPEQRHRELWYNLAREGRVYTSPSIDFEIKNSDLDSRDV